MQNTPRSLSNFVLSLSAKLVLICVALLLVAAPRAQAMPLSERMQFLKAKMKAEQQLLHLQLSLREQRERRFRREDIAALSENSRSRLISKNTLTQ